MNGFIGLCSKNGCAEDLLRLLIDEDLDKALRFAPFDCAGYTGHGSGADQRGPAGFSHLVFRHADLRQRRIDVESVGGDAIADFSGVAIEKVRRDEISAVVV